MGYPSRTDLETRPQVVRRRDAFECLEIAAARRAAYVEFRDKDFLKLAKKALPFSRKYDATARLLGLRIPGAPEREAA